MALAIVLFLVGFVLLIKGGDWFVDGAVGIAHRYHIPEILIGATIVSIGTTIPEVMVSSMAAAVGQSQTAYGNAIGSVICNTALISAITIAAKPSMDVDTRTFRTPVIFFFIAAALYSVTAYTGGYFSRTIGIILLAVFIAYMAITVRQAFTGRLVIDPEEEEEGDKKENPLWKDILFLILGAAVIALGAKLLVDNGKIIAAGLGVPESVIALTFIGNNVPGQGSFVALARKHRGRKPVQSGARQRNGGDYQTVQCTCRQAHCRPQRIACCGYPADAVCHGLHDCTGPLYEKTAQISGNNSPDCLRSLCGFPVLLLITARVSE